MTKEQKIQEAFGKSWSLLSPFMQQHILKVHHWVDRSRNRMNLSPKDLGFDEESECEVRCEFWRPIQLKRIETNNGWIKIESEADLPKYNCGGYFFVFSSEGNVILVNGGNRVRNDYRLGTITHYISLSYPNPPIY